jgi:bacterioferritin
MKGKSTVVEAMNDALAVELTAINQYFLHSRMFENWGYHALAKKMYEESLGEMKHADLLIKRILFLEGVPAISKYLPIHVGKTIPEMFKHDLDLEMEGVTRYRKGVELCLKEGDAASRELLEHILVDSEEHVDWIETQIGLIDQIGLENYLSEKLGEEPGHAH